MRSAPGPSKIICAIFWWLGASVLYIPILTLTAYSFVDSSGAFGLSSYEALITDDRMLSALRLSVWIAFCCATISTVVGGMAAWGMVRGRPLAGKFTEMLTAAPLMLPEVVFGLGLLIWFVFLRVSLGQVSLIIAHVTFSVSYVLLTVRERIRLIDPAIDDAARDLGANAWQVFSRVQLPLMSPALIAGWMMAFTLSFDDFLISFFTGGPDTQTLPMALYAVVKFGVSPEVFAMATVIFVFSFISASLVGKLTAAR